MIPGAIVQGPKGNTISKHHRLRFGKRHVRLPGWQPLRVLLGVAFILGGLLAILPVFGLWMLPIGVLILSVDLAPVRRFRRRIAVWWGRLRHGRTVRSVSPNARKP